MQLQQHKDNCNNTHVHTHTHNTHRHICTHIKISRYNTDHHHRNLQHIAIHCNTLQHIAKHCYTLQHTATHCKGMTILPSLHCVWLCFASPHLTKHSARHCNTLQHNDNTPITGTSACSVLQCVALCCSRFQYAAGCHSVIVAVPWQQT